MILNHNSNLPNIVVELHNGISDYDIPECSAAKMDSVAELHWADIYSHGVAVNLAKLAPATHRERKEVDHDTPRAKISKQTPAGRATHGSNLRKSPRTGDSGKLLLAAYAAGEVTGSMRGDTHK